jgi:hypothetical protein
VTAQYVEAQHGVHAGVQIVVERLMAVCPGKIRRIVTSQHLVRERVDIDQLIVAPARGDGFQAAETQAPGEEEQGNDQ